MGFGFCIGDLRFYVPGNVSAVGALILSFAVSSLGPLCLPGWHPDKASPIAVFFRIPDWRPCPATRSLASWRRPWKLRVLKPPRHRTDCSASALFYTLLFSLEARESKRVACTARCRRVPLPTPAQTLGFLGL